MTESSHSLFNDSHKGSLLILIGGGLYFDS